MKFGKVIFSLTIILSFVQLSFSQEKTKMVLQGIIYGTYYSNVVGTIYIEKDGDQVQIRLEFPGQDEDFVLTKGTWKEKNAQIILQQGFPLARKLGARSTFCRSEFVFNPVDSLGYWRGKIKSDECRNYHYEIILYESTLKFNAEKTNTYGNYWLKEFVEHLSKGYPAPKVVEQMQKNFKLFTIYFDYDKAEIRPEYLAKLNEMAMIVNSHTDFRIRITGHTDSDGSDAYNDGLSDERALAIKNYLVAQGVPEDHIEIAFKGERSPVATNKTAEGKQLNRRVVVQFI